EPPQPPPPKPRPKLPPPRPLRAPLLRLLKSNRLALTFFRLPRTESCIHSLNLPYDHVAWYRSSVPPPTLKFPKSPLLRSGAISRFSTRSGSPDRFPVRLAWSP